MSFTDDDGVEWVRALVRDRQRLQILSDEVDELRRQNAQLSTNLYIADNVWDQVHDLTVRYGRDENEAVIDWLEQRLAEGP